MTNPTGNAIRFHQFQGFLAEIMHHNPEEQVLAKVVQSSCRWIFDFLRNAVIAGGLQYFSDTTGSTTLRVLAYVAYANLVVYCLSYLIPWVFTPFDVVKTKRIGWYGNGLATMIIVGILCFVVLWVLPGTIREIANSQAASHSSTIPPAIK
jgi:hypothetical protein